MFIICEVGGKEFVIRSDSHVVTDNIKMQVVKSAKKYYNINANIKQVKWIKTTKQHEGGFVVDEFQELKDAPTVNKPILFN